MLFTKSPPKKLSWQSSVSPSTRSPHNEPHLTVVTPNQLLPFYSELVLECTFSPTVWCESESDAGLGSVHTHCNFHLWNQLTYENGKWPSPPDYENMEKAHGAGVGWGIVSRSQLPAECLFASTTSKCQALGSCHRNCQRNYKWCQFYWVNIKNFEK